MATKYDTPIDMPIVLQRLRPGSEYHWKGDGWGTYADIGDWRDPHTTKPTEAELYAEWDLYQAEVARQTDDEIALHNRLTTLAASTAGLQADQLSAVQVRALLTLLLWRAGAIQADGTVRDLAEWVV